MVDSATTGAPPNTMDKVTGWCLHHKIWVGVVWALLTVAGFALAPGLADRLDQHFTLPGQGGYEVNQTILKAYGASGGAFPNVVVVSVPAGQRADTPQVKAALTSAMTDIATLPKKKSPALADYRVVYPGTAGAPGSVSDPGLLSKDGRAAFGLVFLPDQTFTSTDPTPDMRAVLTSAVKGLPAGTQNGVTGLVPLSNDSGGGSGSGSGVFAETLLAAVGALVVLAFVFGSFIALMPLVVALVSILTTFVAISGLAEAVSVSFIVQFLIALVGLGVAIDYSLLVVTRWREERDQGVDNEQAVIIAMRTAGHAVVFSGITVAVGLLALVFLPVPFLRSIGYGGLLIPLVSVVVSSTLLPVMLVKFGPFLDRPRRQKSRARAGAISRPWSGWAQLVVRQRWLAAIVALGTLAALGAAAFSIQIGEPKSSTLSQGGRGIDALHLLEDRGVGAGVITPIEVLVPNSDPAVVASAVQKVPGIRTAFIGGTKPGAAVIDAIPDVETSQSPGNKIITPVKKAVVPLGGKVGGSGIESKDFNHAVYGSFPLMLGVIVLVTFVLLARAFRSILLPLKAVVLNLISVGATYGVLVLVWQEGHGSKQIWDIPPTGAVTNWVPIMVFAFLFGLSMDYEVFILARMREEYDTNGSTSAAVVEGIGRTGRLVTSAALILFLAFVSLSQAPGTDIKIFATGLGAGILLDATVVRSLLVPALVSLFGKYNWALPHGFAKVLRVRASPLRADREPALGTVD